MEVINGPKVQRRQGRTTDINTHQISFPPQKLFWEPFSDQEGKPRSPEKGFAEFLKTTPMWFYCEPKPPPPPPRFSSPEPLKLFWARKTLVAGGSPERMLFALVLTGDRCSDSAP